jgi:hypothetical protein
MVVGVAQGQIQDVPEDIFAKFRAGIGDNLGQSLAVDIMVYRCAKSRDICQRIQAVHSVADAAPVFDNAIKARDKEGIVLVGERRPCAYTKSASDLQVGGLTDGAGRIFEQVANFLRCTLALALNSATMKDISCRRCATAYSPHSRSLS